jgi:hypothetical protein
MRALMFESVIQGTVPLIGKLQRLHKGVMRLGVNNVRRALFIPWGWYVPWGHSRWVTNGARIAAALTQGPTRLWVNNVRRSVVQFFLGTDDSRSYTEV